MQVSPCFAQIWTGVTARTEAKDASQRNGIGDGHSLVLQSVRAMEEELQGLGNCGYAELDLDYDRPGAMASG